MGVLKNPRWERFAHEIASGKHATNGEAYLAAGFQIRPDLAKQNAQKLLRRPEVNARIDELRDLATHVERRAADVAGERLGADWAIKKEWGTDRLREIVERSMKEGEFNGNVACRALELLGKEVGMFVDRTETRNVNYGISDQPMTPEEWIKKYSSDATPLAKAKAENEQLKKEIEETRGSSSTQRRKLGSCNEGKAQRRACLVAAGGAAAGPGRLFAARGVHGWRPWWR
jgi:phage terminase small subunit